MPVNLAKYSNTNELGLYSIVTSLNYQIHKTKYLEALHNLLVMDLTAFIDASCAGELMPNKTKKKGKIEFNWYS